MAEIWQGTEAKQQENQGQNLKNINDTKQIIQRGIKATVAFGEGHTFLGQPGILGISIDEKNNEDGDVWYLNSCEVYREDIDLGSRGGGFNMN